VCDSSEEDVFRIVFGYVGGQWSRYLIGERWASGVGNAAYVRVENAAYS